MISHYSLPLSKYIIKTTVNTCMEECTYLQSNDMCVEECTRSSLKPTYRVKICVWKNVPGAVLNIPT